jgi:hypothetical protein
MTAIRNHGVTCPAGENDCIFSNLEIKVLSFYLTGPMPQAGYMPQPGPELSQRG